MPDVNDMYREIMETWRFQVNSYWQRSSYFAAFETALLAGYWMVLRASSAPVWLKMALGILGMSLTTVWMINNQKTHEYVRHWWESLLKLESNLQMREQEADFASQIEKRQKTRPRYRTLMQSVPVLFLIAWIAFTAFAFQIRAAYSGHGASNATTARKVPDDGYFDAHNHGINAILPYYAYADLNAFIKDPADPTKVDLEHRREFWNYLASSGIKCEAEAPCLTGPGNRLAPGAIATLRAYGTDIRGLTPQQINGALERLLTATPWTEFDSAYKIRGGPVENYLKASFGQNQNRIKKALCDAAILELAVTNTSYSEQFVSFTRGWEFKTVAGHRVSAVLDSIRCFTEEPSVLVAAGRLDRERAPTIKVLLMTHTSELGATSDKKLSWMQYGKDGRCEPTDDNLEKLIVTPLPIIEHALLGKDAGGGDFIGSDEKTAFWNAVIGIDTAGPEITCFTSPSSEESRGVGMENYKRLVKEVYSAARKRREGGWHGKLLVHTHVGEGSVTYQLKDIPRGIEAKKVFEKFPGVWMDNATGAPRHIKQAKENIKILIKAVGELKSEFTDIDDFVVFRFGHVTHADIKDAEEMRRLRIEADINLESNISTWAYYSKALDTTGPLPLAEPEQFELNDLAGKVFESGHAAEILSEHSLKYMLAAGVRTLLGSDGGGVEHSDMEREYELAEELIRYWQVHDDHFPHEISVHSLYANVQEHLQDMKTDN